MADEAIFYGTWRIVECVSITDATESTGLEGTEFRLDESGDVTWKVPDEVEPMPFFNCETYEVLLGESKILKFRTFSGPHIEFRVELSAHDDLMLLTYETYCMLQCQKVAENDTGSEFTFSFLSALDYGYFSDVVITADSGKEFNAHKTILMLANSKVDWNSRPTILDGLPEDVIHLTLHFLYAECLPNGLTESTAKACVKCMSRLQGFSRLVELCETFLKNTALKQQIVNLIKDMHICADHIIDYFSGKSTGSEMGHGTEPLMSNPARLCYVVKQSLREATIAGAKLVILSDLFSKRKDELSRQERHDIIKHTKSRLPIFMNQLHRFLEVCKHHFSTLTVQQRQEIAAYLVPEIEAALETISRLVVETKTILEKVISDTNQETTIPEATRRGYKVSEMLGKHLRNALHMRELMKLKSFHERITTSFMNLLQKKENFSVMTQDQKIRSIAKNLEQLIDEVPMFLLRIEELMAALDEKIQWREWKYLFKIGTSKVAWGLSKVVSHQQAIQGLAVQASEIVNRDQFTTSLVTLGLLDLTTKSDMASSSPGAEKSQDKCSKDKTSGAVGGKAKCQQMSLVESLTVPPLVRDSILAQQTAHLLQSKSSTDLIFEVIYSTDLSPDADTANNEAQTLQPDRVSKTTEIPAHRVIVAARCDWFRRALLSGMRESIDKKITVHDTNPNLFKLFLKYLYTGQLDTSELPTEQLADMMAITDRYEMDNVKLLCEQSLKHHIDEDSSLFLLGMADQFNATQLKESVMEFIVDHPEVINCDMFEELPENLQTEVEGKVAWHGSDPYGPVLINPHYMEPPGTCSISSSGEALDEFAQLALNDLQESLDSSLDDVEIPQDSSLLSNCVAQLRVILGDDVPEAELIRISLAADYDANRALNFFFAS